MNNSNALESNMKTMKFKLLTLLILAAASTASAKQVKSPHMYMFGLAASFSDSTVYVTDIQDVPGAWYDTRSHFLMGRDNYSYQLKSYMADQQNQPNRVCTVFFSTNQKKAEKKYRKLLKKYTGKNTDGPIIHHLKSDNFKFEAIDFSTEEQ